MTTTVNPQTGPIQATPFTPAEIVDIRRFAGFPAYAAFGYVYGDFGMANLDRQIAWMTDEEMAVVRTVYLAVLPGLEAAITTAGVNLGTDVAAVWTRNRTEAVDRTRLYNAKRRALCAFIGVAPGPDLGDISRVSRC